MKKWISYIAAIALATVGFMAETPVVTWADTQTEVNSETGTNLESETGTDITSMVIASNYMKKKKTNKAILAENSNAGINHTEETVRDTETGTVEDPMQKEEHAGEAEDSVAAIRQNLVDYALQFVGRPYRAGGNDPHTGADCSGFVRYVMQYGAGIHMNRSSVEQAKQGRSISAAQMQPGDLLFYGNGSRINHVAMYIGDGRVVHASTYKTGIKTSVWNYRTPVRIVSMFG